MSARERARRGERRAAYADYVALFWRLHRLPAGYPDRPALAAAVGAADARWRALMDPGGAAGREARSASASPGSTTISNQ